MADSRRSRRAATATRPRVAGLRKRATQGKQNTSGHRETPVEDRVDPEVSTTDATEVTESEIAENSGENAPDANRHTLELTDSQIAAVHDDGQNGDGHNGDGQESDIVAVLPHGDHGTAGRLADKGPWLSLLIALTLVFGVLAFWFQSNAHALREEGPAANEVLVDSAATSEVNGQISDAVSKLFSYDYTDTATTEKAARELLVGQATKEYEQLFSTVKKEAPRQKLVVTTTVKTSGVTRLQDDRAQVLLFVDQRSVRTDTGDPNVGPAQILVDVEKHGDQWKISNITQR